jgi:hypothetical protein
LLGAFLFLGGRILNLQKIGGGRDDYTRIFYRRHPPLRPVLIGQGQANPSRDSGKGFFEIFYGEFPRANVFTSAPFNLNNCGC